MLTRINQCLINSLAILMSSSGFVYSGLHFLNGLWFLRTQSVGLVAWDEDFDGVGCCIENRALDGWETPALPPSPVVWPCWGCRSPHLKGVFCRLHEIWGVIRPVWQVTLCKEGSGIYWACPTGHALSHWIPSNSRKEMLSSTFYKPG